MFSLDILNQYNDYNGSVLSAGKLYVYFIGRSKLAEIYSDVNGDYPIANPVILDNLGMTNVFLDPSHCYTVVVCDQYDNELFSRDIYPNAGSGGSGSYLYEGIDPIVVNNQLLTISANHIPLGVQEPLYFVQDDEDACIIGFSGGSVDPNEYIPWSASGTFQTAGNYATKEDLNEYTERSAFTSAIESINLNKLDVSSFSSVSSDFLQSSDLNGYATENWVTSQGYLTAVDLTPYQTTAEMTGYLKTGDSANFYTTANESGFITGVDLTPYQTTAGMTAYQPILTLETGSI